MVRPFQNTLCLRSQRRITIMSLTLVNAGKSSLSRGECSLGKYYHSVCITIFSIYLIYQITDLLSVNFEAMYGKLKLFKALFIRKLMRWVLQVSVVLPAFCVVLNSDANWLLACFSPEEETQGCCCIISIAALLCFWSDDLPGVHSFSTACAEDQFSNNSSDLRVLCVVYLVGWLSALCKDQVLADIQDLNQLFLTVHWLRKLNIIENVDMNKIIRGGCFLF